MSTRQYLEYFDLKLLEYSRVEYSRVPGVLRPGMTKYSPVPGALRPEMTGCVLGSPSSASA